jgi:hypothetical protein
VAPAAPELSGPPAGPDGLSIELIRRRLASALVGGHIYQPTWCFFWDARERYPYGWWCP